MSERGEALRRPPRAPMARRTRKRWAVAAGAAACWALLLYQTGSVVAGTALLLFAVALVAGCVLALRSMGISGAHPWVRHARSRPWRDGQDVLQLALRHLPEVFVITPGGTLLAPNSVELWLNPRDFDSLREVMDIGLVNASAAEVYLEEVEAHGARFARPGLPDVVVVPEPSVPLGRYRLRQARPLAEAAAFHPGPQRQLVPAGPLPPPAAAHPGPAGPPAGLTPQAAPFAGQPGPGRPASAPRAPRAAEPDDSDWPFAHDGYTRGAPGQDTGSVIGGLPTMAERGEPQVPALRLVTGGAVRQTRTSGARAGRGEVELVLPEVATVSREHARFTYSGGHWWVENLGRNGLTLNGAPLAGQRMVSDGDSIRWGSNANALESRVEIG